MSPRPPLSLKRRERGMPQTSSDSPIAPGGTLEIVVYPDPVLKRRSSPLKSINGEVAGFSKAMLDAMYHYKGIGLAAPQVGKNLRMLVFDLGAPEGEPRPYCLINPEIVEKDGSAVDEEGCLSLPGLRANVRRSERILLRAWTLDEREIEWEAHGLLARMLQHEIDHLDGFVFIDRLNKALRMITKKRYLSKLKEERRRAS